MGRPNSISFSIYLSDVQICWVVNGAKIHNILHAWSSEAWGWSSGLNLQLGSFLGDLDRDRLLEGSVELVVRGGICLVLQGLGLSHLNFNLLVE